MKSNGNYPPLIKPTHAKPLRVVKPNALSYVREGRFCGRCKYFIDLSTGQQALIKKGWWDKAFHNYDDGHDFKPYHFGDLSMYSICDYDHAVVHYFSTCPHFKPRREFARIWKGILKNK